MDKHLTPAQKAAETRRKNAAVRRERERQKRETAAALEKIIRDEQSSREARENALFLLAAAYKS